MKRIFDIVACGLGLIALSPLFAVLAVEQVMPDKLSIDLEYVSRASLLTDIKLIFSTFREILTQ